MLALLGLPDQINNVQGERSRLTQEAKNRGCPLENLGVRTVAEQNLGDFLFD